MRFNSTYEYEEFVNGFFDREEERKRTIETNEQFEKMVLDAFHRRVEARHFRVIDTPAMNIITDLLLSFPKYSYIKNITISGEKYDLQIDYLNKEIKRCLR